MKKIVRLTESELKNIVEASVQRTIKEGLVTEEMLNENFKQKALELAKIAGVSFLVAAGWLTQIGLGNMTPSDNGTVNGMNKISKQLEATPDTVSQSDIATGKFEVGENRIRRAVMESLKNLVNENG